jgi:hypothetical protein
MSCDKQENIECLNNEGFSEVEAKRQSFSELLPKLTKELEGIYVERLLWMSHMRKDPKRRRRAGDQRRWRGLRSLANNDTRSKTATFG